MHNVRHPPCLRGSLPVYDLQVASQYGGYHPVVPPRWSALSDSAWLYAVTAPRRYGSRLLRVDPPGVGIPGGVSGRDRRLAELVPVYQPEALVVELRDHVEAPQQDPVERPRRGDQGVAVGRLEHLIDHRVAHRVAEPHNGIGTASCRERVG